MQVLRCLRNGGLSSFSPAAAAALPAVRPSATTLMRMLATTTPSTPSNDDASQDSRQQRVTPAFLGHAIASPSAETRALGCRLLAGAVSLIGPEQVSAVVDGRLALETCERTLNAPLVELQRLSAASLNAQCDAIDTSTNKGTAQATLLMRHATQWAHAAARNNNHTHSHDLNPRETIKKEMKHVAVKLIKAMQAWQRQTKLKPSTQRLAQDMLWAVGRNCWFDDPDFRDVVRDLAAIGFSPLPAASSLKEDVAAQQRLATVSYLLQKLHPECIPNLRWSQYTNARSLGTIQSSSLHLAYMRAAQQLRYPFVSEYSVGPFMVDMALTSRQCALEIQSDTQAHVWERPTLLRTTPAPTTFFAFSSLDEWTARPPTVQQMSQAFTLRTVRSRQPGDIFKQYCLEKAGWRVWYLPRRTDRVSRSEQVRADIAEVYHEMVPSSSGPR
ncbi:hypothetical protein CAOG_06472 [Capsaspora owczarzaki ATCC 30864]|uniref:Uncharacterized protein n=1 Tax=Capsaspora owczarzaki (strain ATCC 30864) TaxID=595528 RepID=A0A0D2WVD7_CAPO3|nr:hypothetical protein CAOG_06472 [Capsaspora owczarzaki ATCC 30864]KJE96103.1 hypothetical protein CAOG_006472 [Capsaspora owczarzaki ATCC 30864]|eukprot:XP_004345221.1 hypothetical protein CAOG_06472 [Capsaspora owczarzaki ATCC 30864]